MDRHLGLFVLCAALVVLGATLADTSSTYDPNVRTKLCGRDFLIVYRHIHGPYQTITLLQ